MLTKNTAKVKFLFNETGLTRVQLAEELGVSRDAVQKMIQVGRIPERHIGKLMELIPNVKFENSGDIEDFLIERDGKEYSWKELFELEKLELEKKNKKQKVDLHRYSDQQLVEELERRHWDITLKLVG